MSLSSPDVWKPFQLALDLDMDLKLNLAENQYSNVVTFIEQGKTGEKQKALADSLRKLPKEELISKTEKVALLVGLLKRIQENNLKR